MTSLFPLLPLPPLPSLLSSLADLLHITGRHYYATQQASSNASVFQTSLHPSLSSHATLVSDKVFFVFLISFDPVWGVLILGQVVRNIYNVSNRWHFLVGLYWLGPSRQNFENGHCPFSNFDTGLWPLSILTFDNGL